MPIIVKDFSWYQTPNSVTLKVPRHGIPSFGIHILITREYVKASFGQFFFELFPYEAFEPEESGALIEETQIVFELRKVSPKIWDDLQKKLSKSEKKEIKLKAVQEAQEMFSREFEDKIDLKHKLKKEAVSLAVEADTRQRNCIEAIKNEEKVKALGDVEEWSVRAKPSKEKPSKVVQSHYKKFYREVERKPEDPAIPLPRNRTQEVNKVVEVSFTPRALPTPSRESKAAEENEWLSKQAEARRTAGFVSEDLRPEEKNPHFIMKKGRDFLRNQNFLGAISAFTFGIEISPKLVDFYILRSEAHFAIGNHHKCVHDCSTALEMMKPEVYANLSQRVECIHRRGMALFKLGLKRQAEDELKAAIKLQPSRELTRDLYEIMDSPEFVEKESAKVGLQEIDH